MSIDTQHPPAAAAAGALIAVLGPLAGEHATVLLAALAGAMWPLASSPTATRMQAAWLLLRLVATAAALGGFTGWLLEHKAGVPSQYAPTVAAWAIGALGNRWQTLITDGWDRLRGTTKVMGTPQ